jgi:hypothetical protein
LLFRFGAVLDTVGTVNRRANLAQWKCGGKGCENTKCSLGREQAGRETDTARKDIGAQETKRQANREVSISRGGRVGQIKTSLTPPESPSHQK